MDSFEKSVFCDRANSLFGDTGQVELAQKIGVTQGVISAIKNSKVKAPGADTLYKISKAFSVSSDWLLGLSDVRSTEPATRALCDALGLSDTAIDLLSDPENKEIRNAVNSLLHQHKAAMKKRPSEGCGCNEWALDNDSVLMLLSALLDILKEKKTRGGNNNA